MINTIINWVKTNKVLSLLIAVMLVLVISNFGANQPSPVPFSLDDSLLEKIPSSMSTREGAPQPQTRMLAQEAALSVVVRNIQETVKKVIIFAESQNGYLVNASLTKPEEAPYAQIIVRVPANKLNETVDYYKSLGTKVVFENLTGRDVTSEYVDIEARLATLYEGKEQLEGLMRKSGKVSELLEAQREILNVQSQIDSYVGQQRYLKEISETAKITLDISTDELALPYAPSGTFNVRQMFKEAFRSLLLTFDKLLNILVWALAYSILVVPAAGLGYLGYRVYKKKRQQ